MPTRPNLLLIVLLMGFTWYGDPGQFSFRTNQIVINHFIIVFID